LGERGFGGWLLQKPSLKEVFASLRSLPESEQPKSFFPTSLGKRKLVEK